MPSIIGDDLEYVYASPVYVEALAKAGNSSTSVQLLTDAQ